MAVVLILIMCVEWLLDVCTLGMGALRLRADYGPTFMQRNDHADAFGTVVNLFWF